MSDENQNEFNDGIPVDVVADDEEYMTEDGGVSFTIASGMSAEGGIDVGGISVVAGSFDPTGGISMNGATSSEGDAAGMGEEGEEEGTYVNHDDDGAPGINDGGGGDDDAQEERGHGGNEEEGRPTGMSSEMETISRQAKNELEKALTGAGELAGALFTELGSFLVETEAIQKEMALVQDIVHAESARLDELEPQVESATRHMLS